MTGFVGVSWSSFPGPSTPEEQQGRGVYARRIITLQAGIGEDQDGPILYRGVRRHHDRRVTARLVANLQLPARQGIDLDTPVLTGDIRDCIESPMYYPAPRGHWDQRVPLGTLVYKTSRHSDHFGTSSGHFAMVIDKGPDAARSPHEPHPAQLYVIEGLKHMAGIPQPGSISRFTPGQFKAVDRMLKRAWDL